MVGCFGISLKQSLPASTHRLELAHALGQLLIFLEARIIFCHIFCHSLLRHCFAARVLKWIRNLLIVIIIGILYFLDEYWCWRRFKDWFWGLTGKVRQVRRLCGQLFTNKGTGLCAWLL